MKGIAELAHDAKRCFVYEYGKDELSGKITIQKRLLTNGDIDFVDAIETGDITIDNRPDAKEVISLGGVSVESLALSLLSVIVNAYEEKGKMPERVEC